MRRRVWLLVAATTSLVALAFIVPLSALVASEAHARAIMDATTQSRSVVPLVAAAEDRAAAEAARAATRDEFAVLVTLPKERTVGPPAGVWRGGTPSTAIRHTTVRQLDDGAAVVDQPVFRSDGTAIVSVWVSGSAVQRGVTRARLVLGLLGVTLVGLSLLAADRLARSMTRPVTELAAAADRMGRGELDQVVLPAGPPEIREVGVALNALGRRITALLVSEREAVADLSHQLRTPLTALRLDAESLRDPDEQARLSADVERVISGVDAVIAHARRPVPQSRPSPAVSDLVAVTKERIAFWGVLAEEQSRTVTTNLPHGPCLVAAARNDVAAALDALLDNVFAHTPEGSGFRVTVTPEQTGGGTLTVTDEGLGFPDAAVLERGTSRAGSSGLGLDIAQRLARASGGSAHISTGPGGAQVRLSMGGPRAAPGEPGLA
jgi:signal transduction histidine kinase